MTDALIKARFRRLHDLLDDLELVSDGEMVEDLRDRTDDLEEDYRTAFEEALPDE